MNENKKNIARWVLTAIIFIVLGFGISNLTQVSLDVNFLDSYTSYENTNNFWMKKDKNIDILMTYLREIKNKGSSLRINNLQKQLEDNHVIYYYQGNDGKIISNIENPSKNLTIENFAKEGEPYYSFELGEDYPENPEDFYQDGGYADSFPDDLQGTIFMKFEPDYYRELEQNWMQERHHSMYYFKIFLASIGVVLILMIFYTVVLYRDKHINFFTNFYSELYILFFFIASFIFGLGLNGFTRNYDFMYQKVMFSINLFAYCALLFVLYTILIRKIASKTLFKRSLVYALGSPLLKSKKYESLDAVEKLKTRTFGFIAIAIGLVFFYFIFRLSLPLVFCLEIFLVYFYSKGNEDLYEQVKEEEKVNLQKMNRADLQRVELITNVSHDLKTPLTSIISYSDLMQHEDDPNVLKEYAKVIETKSKQLSTIIVDLFELAKTSSGNAEVHMESIRFDALIEQTIADMQDEIEKANRQVKIKLPKNQVWILSDGARLRRVLDNLIVNCLKYSLENTRIYVNLSVEKHNAILKIINTSSYEMTFTKEDILSRFYRADESRSKDGNGLGLSIAESFTSISGGEFDIEILGDQFVSILKFPIQAQKNQSETDKPA